MDDADVIGNVLEGWSLRTLMVPDPRISTNFPEHVETYDLPHVIINGDYFWGKSESVHLLQEFDQQDGGNAPFEANMCFCYTNFGDIFCSFLPRLGRARLMWKRRYKKHIWHPIDDHGLIWEYGRGDAPEILRDHIEECAKFRIALLDSENVWNIHPVDLPMYYPESSTFELKTASDFYPSFFRNAEQMDGVVTTLETSLPDGALGAEELSVETVPTFYGVFSDGTYYDYFDIPQGTRQKYKGLKVFSDLA